MANCTFCGRKLGFLDNQYSKFKGDPGVCESCSNLLDKDILPQIQTMILKQKNLTEITENICKKYANTNIKKTYLNNYVFYILHNEIVEDAKHRQYLEEFRQKLAIQKLTTGYSFDGYKIVDYKGVISGETVIGTGMFSEFSAAASDLLGVESDAFSNKMRDVKNSALYKLKERSVIAGGNAVIGIDFDYINFSNNMIGVSANGTSVIIEEITQDL